MSTTPADRNSSYKVVIPARYGSTRLPGKALIPIAGKPMIVHVCERALESGADEVVIATDDQRIADAVASFNVRSVMTRADHNSGTERLAEAAALCGWSEETIIVNLQGDEPLIPPSLLQLTASALAGQQRAEVATIATAIHSPTELFNPNAVKVVLDRNGYALYFSRAPIPWDRSRFGQRDDHTVELNENSGYLRHIGLYAYRVGFLQRYIGWSVSPLESIESLEQLRILWHGEPIHVSVIAEPPEAGIDTEEDRQRVEQIIKRRAEQTIRP